MTSIAVNYVDALAFMSGGKTQIRIPVSPAGPGLEWRLSGVWSLIDVSGPVHRTVHTLPYIPGNRIPVREPWRAPREFDRFHADDIPPGTPIDYTASSIDARLAISRTARSLPAWACRLHLRLRDVRVAAIQDMKSIDAIAEGIRLMDDPGRPAYRMPGMLPSTPTAVAPGEDPDPARASFARKWNISHTASHLRFEANPTVAVLYVEAEGP